MAIRSGRSLFWLPGPRQNRAGHGSMDPSSCWCEALARTAPRRRSPAQETDAAHVPPEGSPVLPLPWEVWPAETRLLVGLTALWSLVGLLVLTSASWWVADREMGDAA